MSIKGFIIEKRIFAIVILTAAVAAFFASQSLSQYVLKKEGGVEYASTGRDDSEPKPNSKGVSERKSFFTSIDDRREADDTDEAVPTASLPPIYHPRDPNEWQGMLVDLRMQAVCDGPSSCGLAMACINSKCGPCERDRDCAVEESCVLDHCVKSNLVACKTRQDCVDDELCVLTGVVGGEPRGNSEMRAVCVGSTGGYEQKAEEVDLSPGSPAEPAPYEPKDLIANVRNFVTHNPETEKEDNSE